MKNSKVVDYAKLAFNKICLTGVGLGMLAMILAHMAIHSGKENKKTSCK
tara:strand:+ start:505 stop:651 length:147 start_codon:yes stop_codon:yes gene_type:complete